MRDTFDLFLDRLRVCRIKHDIAHWEGPFVSHGAACDLLVRYFSVYYPDSNLRAELSVPQPL
jgi:hypothetical protein